MVHAAGFSRPQRTVIGYRTTSRLLLHCCRAGLKRSFSLPCPPTLQRQLQDVTLRDFDPWGHTKACLLVQRKDTRMKREEQMGKCLTRVLNSFEDLKGLPLSSVPRLMSARSTHTHTQSSWWVNEKPKSQRKPPHSCSSPQTVLRAWCLVWS